MTFDSLNVLFFFFFFQNGAKSRLRARIVEFKVLNCFPQPKTTKNFYFCALNFYIPFRERKQ